MCQIDLEQVLFGRLDALADRLRNLLGLTRAIADHALSRIADDDKRRERHVLAALDDLGDTVNGDDLILEVHPVAVESLLHCHDCS